MIILPLGHDYVVAKVDKLVTDILSPNIRITIQQISEQLSLYYQPMTSLYNNELEYTDSIRWFIGSCYLVCGKCYPSEVVWDEAMTKNFIYALSSYQHEFAIAVSDFAFQEQRNSQSLQQYMNHYLSKYSRVLIVRVDLKIKIESAHLVGVETFSYFMDQLMDKIQRDREKAKKREKKERQNIKVINKEKECFEGLRGYAWAIEQGVETGGLHCHLLLIYNGDKRKADWFLADSVGKRWVEITNGLGSYYNCHTNEYKRSYERKGMLGIGMIHKDKSLEVNNTMRAALYLTRPDKFEQRLKAWLPNMRSFGRGTIK